MTWQSNVRRYLEKKGLNGTHGWVQHNTPNRWESLCHYWSFANPELFAKLNQAIIDLDKSSPEFHYYIGIGTCQWPVTTGSRHKRKHYFGVYRYPKNRIQHERKQMERLLKRKA